MRIGLALVALWLTGCLSGCRPSDGCRGEHTAVVGGDTVGDTITYRYRETVICWGRVP